MSDSATPPTDGGTRPISATGWRANSLASQSVRSLRHEGREYLRFPLVAMTEMVLEYPERGTSEYLPASSIRETAEAWDGVPLTYVHPDNRKKTVYDPDSFMGDVIGAFHDPTVLDGGSRLRGYGLIDVGKAEDIGGEAERLVELLRAGKEVSVSAGYVTVDDEHRQGTFDGDAYDLVQGSVIPDHVAVFPSDTAVMARCSPEDGCAAPRANAYQASRVSGDNRRPSENQHNGASKDMSSSAADPTDGGTEPTDEEIEEFRRELAELQAMVIDLIEQKEAAQQRANAEQCGCTSGGRPHANMAGVPGSMQRDLDDGRDDGPNEEEFPAGGRKAWERRQVGLDEIPDEHPSGLASGRSNYEKAKKRRMNANAEESDTDGQPTGTRSSYEGRQNATDDADSGEWLTSEYPHTAKRMAEEREEKQERQEELTRLEMANSPPPWRGQQSQGGE